MRQAGYAQTECGRAMAGDEVVYKVHERSARLWRRQIFDQLHFCRVCIVGNADAATRTAQVNGQYRRHPLTPVATMESTKKRCRNTKRITGGSTANVAPAITSPVFMAPRL